MDIGKYELINDEIVGKKILVLSPHQDDESIGLGGTILKLKENNDIFILFATDGTLIDYSNFPKSISKTRQEEAKEVAEMFGAKHAFIPFTNTTLRENKIELEGELLKYIGENKFDIIFTPSPAECTQDHRELTFALLSAIRKIQKESETIASDKMLEIYFYEINNSLQGNSINTISPLDKYLLIGKKKAYDIYKSQKFIDFSTIIINDVKKSLVLNESAEGAEFFHKLDIKNIDYIFDLESSCDEFDQMKTTTSAIKLRKNMDFNTKFRKKIEEVLK